jgi:hypothetical protein
MILEFLICRRRGCVRKKKLRHLITELMNKLGRSTLISLHFWSGQNGMRPVYHLYSEQFRQCAMKLPSYATKI